MSASGTQGPRASALTKRVLTAAVLGPLVLWTVFHPGMTPLTILLLVCLAAAAWEWSALAGLQGGLGRVAYALVSTGLGLLALYGITSPEAQAAVSTLAVIAWSGATLLVVRVARGTEMPIWPVLANLLQGWLVLLPFWLCVLWLKRLDFRFLIALVALIWLADTFAYFGGKRWGRHLLAPRVSPGKTWEGVAAAAVAAPLVAGLIMTALGQGSAALFAGLTALGVVTIACSIVGDLFESLQKRRAGVKDSGTLLPGHGGVMDRIDSLTAAAPLFYLGITWLVPNT